ncbi:hypothetical protein J5X84_37530 [Streptosporangiaceae bacterium NEAU-GS5]|nr:hypothetical protein [Streptosporangiaceae bacterium NEAU-GS5]
MKIDHRIVIVGAGYTGMFNAIRPAIEAGMTFALPVICDLGQGRAAFGGTVLVE